MRVIFCILFAALSLQAFAKGVKQELKVTWGGHTYLLNPDADCWSQHEIAQTTWPNPSWVVKGKTNSFAGAQMRVRGDAGDRTNRNYLVRNLNTEKLIRPDAKYFRRADPFIAGAPMPPQVVATKSVVKESLSTPPARVIHMSWVDCGGAVAFRVYTSNDLAHWTLYQETSDFTAPITCDQTGPNYFGVKAVGADGSESGWGSNGMFCP